jgi:hypothetical protein
LSESGLLAGTPAAAGFFSVTLRISAGECVVAYPFAGIVLQRRLTIAGESVLPSGRVGDSYFYQFAATGAVGIASPLLIWSAASLPKGLSIDPSSGRVSGKPATAGVFLVDVGVEQRAGVGDDQNILALGVRRVTIQIVPGPGAPFNLSPLQLRFSFGPGSALPGAQSLLATSVPLLSAARAEACAVNRRLGSLGYPVINVVPAENVDASPNWGFKVSVTFSQTAPKGDPCAAPAAAEADEIPASELTGEIRVYRQFFGDAIVGKAPGPRAGTVQDPEYRVLVVMSYSEGSLLVVPERITLRLNREGGPLPTKLVPIVSRQWGVERNFTVVARTITPANLTWLSINNTGATPAALEARTLEAARELVPGVYLTMLEVTVQSPPAAQAKPGERLADTGEVLKVPVRLVVGPDIDFQFTPDTVTYTNPPPNEMFIKASAPDGAAQETLQSTIEHVSGPADLVTASQQTFVFSNGLHIRMKKPSQNGSYRAELVVLKPRRFHGVLEIKVNVTDASAELQSSTPEEIAVPQNAAAPVESDGSITATNNSPDSGPGAMRAAASESKASDDRLAEVGGVPFQLSVASVGDWLTVEHSSRVTPSRLKLTVDPRKVRGTNPVAGLLTVESQGTSNPVLSIPIALRLLPPAIPSNTGPPPGVGPRFANGDGWSSRLVVINPSAQPVEANVIFRPTGASASIAFAGFAFAELPDRGLLREVTRTMAPFSTMTLTTQGVGNMSGWVEIRGTPLLGYVLLRRTDGTAVYETALPLTAGLPSGTILPFDNTSGATTSFSLANPSPAQGRFVLTARDSAGRLLGRTDPQPVLPFTGRLVNLSDLLRSTGTAVGVAGEIGSVEFTSLGIDTTDAPNPVAQVVTGPPLPIAMVRQNQLGNINALPPLPLGSLDGAAATRVIPYIAFGGGWDARVSLFNADFVGKIAVLSFTGDTGLPLANQDDVVATVPPLGSFHFRARGPLAKFTPGSAELLATPGIGAHAVLSYESGGRTAETTIRLEPSPAGKLLVPFDNTDGFETQLVLVSPDVSSASAQVAIYDASGARLNDPARSKIDVSRRLQFALPSRFPETAGRMGVLELTFARDGAAAAALRTRNGGLSTSLPVF